MLSVTRKFFILKMNELEELKILKFVLRIFYHVILIKRMQRDILIKIIFDNLHKTRDCKNFIAFLIGNFFPNLAQSFNHYLSANGCDLLIFINEKNKINF